MCLAHVSFLILDTYLWTKIIWGGHHGASYGAGFSKCHIFFLFLILKRKPGNQIAIKFYILIKSVGSINEKRKVKLHVPKNIPSETVHTFLSSLSLPHPRTLFSSYKHESIDSSSSIDKIFLLFLLWIYYLDVLLEFLSHEYIFL